MPSHPLRLHEVGSEIRIFSASWQVLSVGGLPCAIFLSFFLPLQSTLALLMSYYAHGSFVQYCIVALPVFKT